MRAITIPEPGGPDALVWAEVPDPEPGPGEVVLDVRASAVNRADLLQRQGLYPPPPGAPAYPGLECSGVVGAVGAGVTGWEVGQEVCALLAGGGYAERVAVPAGQLLPVPAGVDVVDAAALPEVACTVWSNVVHLARLASGETLLVHGGGSGIGTFAVQLGAALGATVVATARGVKHERLRELGAAHAVDYREQDFVEEVRTVTGGRGADVILDIMGASYLSRNVAALADGGRLVVIGMQGGRKAELDLGALLAKRGSVAATALRSRPAEQKAEIVRGVREQVWPLVEAGRVRPIVDRRLPMSEAAEAHRLVESNDHVGKVLLTTG
ncbi:NAD(P)H-quinone oxidoreductase [Micromonospora endolithica]|uniref:NAD(P)H-quinone oxidoreductase n=1 Tax=Micromonospora endolithica TaxID=230091 RepID=A0A3A9ZEQ9_9ACTN|nr:NAD(P)H-quinone oxidoreductase [Micromonospora endolithica]RKN46204.1 NAD(P)H-quinone oxidoreductase [Micromonospora endolithica]TWJ25079.1 putative PIG3 family NAD(P)H quinone oxidoreductase [Micromonospora endolithica]